MTDIGKGPLAEGRGRGRSRETHREAVASVRVGHPGGLPGAAEEWRGLGHRLRAKSRRGCQGGLRER